MFGRNKKDSDDVKPAKVPAPKKLVLTPSVISADMHVLGNIISTDGVLDIDGQIDGNVRCHTASIRENARIRGDVVAEHIYIHGTIEGLVKARQVTLYASARVIGTIMHEALSIEDGAFVDGKFKRTDRLSDDEAFSRRVSEVELNFVNDNDEPASEAELLVLENLRLIR
jgi:cytoskeletal protein CcmA (bactofilin family)